MLTNISISEFKTLTDTETIQIVKNPNTSKLFAACGKDKNFKVQQAIDVAKPIDFMYEDDESVEGHGVANGCFVNSNQDNVVATL